MEFFVLLLIENTLVIRNVLLTNKINIYATTPTCYIGDLTSQVAKYE